MSEQNGAQRLRLRIGNISTALAEKPELLSSRIAKFGSIIDNLDLHTKPTHDHYFAFITVEFPDKGFQKFKASLAGAVFMGRKLSVDIAKPDYRQRWLEDSKRPDEKHDARQRQFQIHLARQERIKESQTPYHINRFDNSIVQIPPRTSYMLSPHTFNNLSGNTKHQPPSQTLRGDDSYGALTKGKPIVGLLTSRTSGGGEFCKGRMRTTPRSKLAQKLQTMRILINGKATQIKAFKTKLWGYEKNKTVNDLTWSYSDGQWISGDKHVIERVESVQHKIQPTEQIDGTTLNEEIEKNTSVLASLISGYDFEKPVELLEDNEVETVSGISKQDIVVDTKGRKKVTHFDYEIEGNRANDDEDAVPISSEARRQLELFKESAGGPVKEQYFDEDDESDFDIEALKMTSEEQDGDIEVVTEGNTEVQNVSEDTQAKSAQNVDNVTEKSPEYTTEPSEVPEDSHELSDEPSLPPQSQTQPTTEALRTLLNPHNESSGFKLALSEEDEDVDSDNIIDSSEQARLLEQIKQKQQQLRENGHTVQSKARGLFWPHSDSPFLQSQSQLSKIGALAETVTLLGENEPDIEGREGESPFEKWFWSKRGEIGRECKRRKRDVARAFKKSSRGRPVD